MKTEELIQLTEKGKPYLTVSMLDQIMVHKWNGVVSEASFKIGIDKIEELTLANKPIGYMSDLIAFSGIGPISQQYAAAMTSNYVKNYFANTHPNTKFKQLMLVTKDIFVQVSAQGYAKRLDEKENIETVFTTTTLSEAYRLLDLKE